MHPLRMEKGSLSQDASCIMKMAGIEQFNRKGKSTNEPYWDVSGRPAKDEDGLLKKLYTPETAERMYDKFREDYELFHLPKPKWISEASGELIDSVDHHACHKTDDSW